jgi:hypothetical protein
VPEAAGGCCAGRVFEQLGGQEPLPRPGRRLKQGEEGRQALGTRAVEQDGKDRQALRLVVRAEVPVQRDLHLGADPAPRAIASDQDDERRAALQRVLQARHPLVAGADRLLVVKDRQPGLLQGGAKRAGRAALRPAVAEEDRSRLRACGFCHDDPGSDLGCDCAF